MKTLNISKCIVCNDYTQDNKIFRNEDSLSGFEKFFRSIAFIICIPMPLEEYVIRSKKCGEIKK